MAQLSLKERRARARGISRRVIPGWAGRKYAGIGNRATLTLGTGNAQLAFFAKVPGTGGNSITIQYAVAGASTPLSVSVVGNAITVNVATSAGSAAISTATDVKRAIDFDLTAGAMVQAYRPLGSDGTGVVAAVGATALSGAV